MPKFPEPTFKRRSWRLGIADLLTGGELTMLRDGFDFQTGLLQAYRQKLANALSDGVKSNDDHRKEMSDALATVKEQRAALDQISAELTGHIDAIRSGPPTASALRAIRALTKGTTR